MHYAEIALELETRDPRLHTLVAPGTTLHCIAGGFVFTEGPIWVAAEQAVIFSDIIGNTMYRWSAADGLSVFRQPSNMANGNTLDGVGRIVTCEHATSRVVRAEHDGTLTVLASHYNGRELNSPNDIVISSNGSIYFTDPTSGRTAKWGVERAPELPFRGVYAIAPDGTLTLLVDDFSKPNGLCFDADERHLFVNDTDRAHIRVFDLRDDGTLVNGRLWAELTGTGEGVADGMKIDAQGNIYCCGPGGIHVVAADATSLGVLHLPEKVANFAWGDADRGTLYITASTSLYALPTLVPGYR